MRIYAIVCTLTLRYSQRQILRTVDGERCEFTLVGSLQYDISYAEGKCINCALLYIYSVL